MEIVLVQCFQMINNETSMFHLLFEYIRDFGYIILFLIIQLCVIVVWTFSPMKIIKNHTYQMYCAVNTLCKDTSFHRSSTTISSSPVKVTFQMEWKLDRDLHGRYSIMEAVKITIAKTITATGTTTNGSTALSTTDTSAQRPTSTTLIEGMTISTTVSYDAFTAHDQHDPTTGNADDEDDVLDSNEHTDDTATTNNDDSQALPLKHRLLRHLDANTIDYDYNMYVIV